MPTPASRLLEVLELLQSRPVVSGREIADHLAVDGRTVRRYIDNLQELGIPVEGQRGVGGGYRLQPGLPAAAADAERRRGRDGRARARGSATARARRGRRPSRECAREDPSGPAGDAPAAGRGARGGGRVHELRHGGCAGRAEVLLLVSDAIRRRHRLRTSYTSFSGDRSDRELSPYGLVVHAGRWYLAAHDHGRDALRTFRIDRMDAVSMTTAPAAPAPDGFDAVAHVAHSLASVPWRWEVEVLLEFRSPRRRRGSRRRSPSSSTRARRPDRASHAGRIARLDGGRAGRARLWLHRRPAARAARRASLALARRLEAQVASGRA